MHQSTRQRSSVKAKKSLRQANLAVTSKFCHFSLLIQRKYSIKVYLTTYFCSNTLQRPPWDTRCSKNEKHCAIKKMRKLSGCIKG